MLSLENAVMKNCTGANKVSFLICVGLSEHTLFGIKNLFVWSLKIAPSLTCKLLLFLWKQLFISSCYSMFLYLRTQWFVFFLQIFELLLQGVQREKSWSWHIVFSGTQTVSTHTRETLDSIIHMIECKNIVKCTGVTTGFCCCYYSNLQSHFKHGFTEYNEKGKVKFCLKSLRRALLSHNF